MGKGIALVSIRGSGFLIHPPPADNGPLGAGHRQRILKTDCSVEGSVLVRSIRSSTVLILVLLLVQGVLPAFSNDVEASASARGGTNDDFMVTDIQISNSSFTPSMWFQGDGTAVEYVFKGESVPITMTVKRSGSSFNPAKAEVLVEVVHPIGFVSWSANWTTPDMYGGQTESDEFVWIADTAHSILNGSELEGGMIIRTTVSYFADTKNENDVLNMTVPVAYTNDIMDGTLIGGARVTMAPFRYSPDGGDATAAGSWENDNSSANVGTGHWRHSTPGSNYPSNAFDRIVWGYFPSDGNCENAHHEGGAGAVYGWYYCKMVIPSLDLLSVQFHATAWGVISSGDDVALELWRSGGVSVRHNFTTTSPALATGQNQWTNMSWDPTAQLGGHSWYAGVLFHSDNSMAAEGYHVDDWVVFAVDKVSEYTLDVDCDNPEAGYTAVPNEVITLHCMVTNNGYKPAIIRVKTNVSNETWMDFANPMLRIDSSHPSNHGMEVQLPATPSGNTTEMWINLSIPAGSDVQQQTWNVTWSDGSSQNLGVLASRSMPVAVSEQYGVSLYSSTSLIADTLMPGETGVVPMRLQNAGNKIATYNLAASFSDTSWTASFTNDTGTSFLPIAMGRGESVNFFVHITVSSLASPENYSFSVRAICITCGTTPVSGNDVLIRHIHVPAMRNVEINAEFIEISAPADGILRNVPLEITNLGNDDEVFDMVLTQSNNLLMAGLTTEVTGTIGAWDDVFEMFLNLPMPLYLPPGLYSATIRVVSQNDASVWDSVTISVTVEETAGATVYSDNPEQSYIPGDDADSVRFEIRNEGNSVDRFNLAIETGVGMNAELQGLGEGLTPLIAPGASYNITVSFTFAGDAMGQIPLTVIATSQNDPSVSSNGEITFPVGSQGWLRLTVSSDDLVINEAGTYPVLLTLRNQYTAEQTVTIDIDQGSSSTWFRASSDSTSGTFTIQEGRERMITVDVVITDTTLLNLYQAELVTNFEVWARSDTLADATNATVKVTLTKSAGTDDDGLDSTQSSGGNIVLDIGIWAIGIGAILFLLVFLVRVVMERDEDESSPWDNEEYESSLEAQYGAVPAAPDVPSAPDMSSFARPSTPVPEALPPAQQPVAAATATPSPTAPGVPPVPSAGLPEGWTMEQWTHYGAQWLEKNS